VGDGTLRQWAVECWQVARDVVYRDIAPAGNPPAITEDYIAQAQPVVDEQIQPFFICAALRERRGPHKTSWPHADVRTG
jgi:hypothetical protein